MEEIAISKFKATCLAVLEQVRVTGKPILVTRFGKPVAEVAPIVTRKKGKKVKSQGILGSMEGTVTIVGDIMAPLHTDADMAEWDKNWDQWLGAKK